MDERKVIKIEDRTLKELLDKAVGYRKILDDLALRYSQTSRDFWLRAKELYGLDLKNKRYLADPNTYEIVEDC